MAVKPYRTIAERLVTILAAVLAITACGRSDQRNLLLITADTLRADSLGTYGYTEPISPNLDRLAQRSMVFESAQATAALTGPSHASILTSQPPSAHGIVLNGHRRPDRISVQSRTLAEHLRDADGFATGAVISSVPLSARYGFDRGFDTFVEVVQTEKGELGGSGRAVTEAALAFLADHRREPFLLWVHYFDSHLPYICPDDVYAELGIPRTVVHDPRGVTMERLLQAYRSEVYELDRRIGSLLAGLERLGLHDTTVVAFVADHGEHLGEHGLFRHKGLFNEVLRVPMMIAVPGAVAGSRRTDVVSTIDLLPTLLEILGTPPLPGVQGRSLIAESSSRDEVPVFAEWRDHKLLRNGRTAEASDFLVSVQQGTDKLIESRSDPGTLMLFDLSEDPLERNNIATKRPEATTRLKALLDRHIRDDLPWGLIGEQDIVIEQDHVEQLKALGYIER